MDEGPVPARARRNGFLYGERARQLQALVRRLVAAGSDDAGSEGMGAVPSLARGTQYRLGRAWRRASRLRLGYGTCRQPMWRPETRSELPHFPMPVRCR